MSPLSFDIWIDRVGTLRPVHTQELRVRYCLSAKYPTSFDYSQVHHKFGRHHDDLYTLNREGILAIIHYDSVNPIKIFLVQLSWRAIQFMYQMGISSVIQLLNRNRDAQEC